MDPHEQIGRPASSPKDKLNDKGQDKPQGWRKKLIVEERFVPLAERRNLFLTSIVLATVGVALFVTLLVSVTTHSGLEHLDQPVTTWFMSIRSDEATFFMGALAIVFGPTALPIIVLVVLVIWIAVTRHIWRPILLAAGMVTGVVLAKVIAPLVQHPRPPLSQMLMNKDSTFSFPSGHVLGTADFVLILAFLIASRRRRSVLTVLLYVVAGLVIAAQVTSRLYLGYHWLSDTMASVALSLIILGVLIAIDTARTVRVVGERVHGEHSQPQMDGT